MEIEKRNGKIVYLPRNSNVNRRYGSYNWKLNKSIWLELTGVVEHKSYSLPLTNQYQFKLRKLVNELIVNSSNSIYFNEKNILIIDYSTESISIKGKSYYTLLLTLSVQPNILFKDPEFNLVIVKLIDDINELIKNEGSFTFLESKLR